MAKLEYGEWDELEDKLHDLSLFYKEDGGAGANREAKHFTGSQLERGEGVERGGGEENKEG